MNETKISSWLKEIKKRNLLISRLSDIIIINNDTIKTQKNKIKELEDQLKNNSIK